MAAGESYLEEPFPIDKIKSKRLQIPSMDSGLVLALFSDLYDATGESGWLAAGTDLTVDICDVYFENTLPVGASNINWYQSQLCPAFLIHGLGRLASLVQDNCIIEPNYTLRQRILRISCCLYLVCRLNRSIGRHFLANKKIR